MAQSNGTITLSNDPLKQYFWFITEGQGTGQFISNMPKESYSSGNYLHLNSNGIEVVKYINNQSIPVAKFGSTVTVGIEDDNHVFIDSNGVKIKNNSTVLAEYGSDVTIGSTSGEHIYIDNNSLQFRIGTGQNDTKATLNSNGLVLAAGGVDAGTAGTNDFVYLSSIDYPNQLAINGHIPTSNDPAWREIIGTNFGVDAAGNLYASDVHISGTINASNGNIGGCFINNGLLEINAARITDGQFATARIPQLTISKIDTLQDTLNGKAAVGAENTAYSYLYYDANSGLKIAQSNPSSTTSNYIQIISTGIDIVQSNTYKVSIDATNGMLVYAGDANNAVAQFGSTMRIGKANDAAFHINSNSLTAYYMDGNTRKSYFEVSPSGMSYGSYTVASTTYADQAENNAKIAAQGYANIVESKTSYSVEIQVTEIDYVNNSATLVAIPYYQGSTTLPSGVDYQWYKNGNALTDTDTPPTISGVDTNTLELGQGTDFGGSITNAIYTCVISETT